MCQGWGIYTIGTCRTNRQGIPLAHYRYAKTGANKGARGAVRQLMKQLPNGTRLYFVSWMDNKPVNMLSTLKSKITRVQRTTQEGTRAEISCPTNVGLYNAGMGGTDLIDQQISYYAHRIKTLKWQQKFYSHFLNVSVANARVLYELDTRKKITMLDFTQELIESLCNSPNVVVPAVARNSPNMFSPVLRNLVAVGDLPAAIDAPLTHTPVLMGTRSVEDYRTRCKCCGVKTSWKCDICNIPLCLHKRNSASIVCWKLHHEELALSSLI